jgi:hypothetical protein
LLLLACKSKPEGYFESSNLPGMIYDADNRPCDKVLLSVWYIDDEGEENEVSQVRSDINGRFTIPNLQRGSYRILGEKEGYEKITSVFYYSSRLDVLYLKILSQKEILKSATEALYDRRFGKVEELLIRSETINSNDPNSLYLKAVFLFEKNLFEEALIPLQRIEEQGFKFPYVHLFMADIYQYELNQPLLALDQLKEYLNLLDDSELYFRMKELEEYEI